MNKLCKFFFISLLWVMLFYPQATNATGTLPDFNKITKQLNDIEQNLKSENFSLQNVEENTNFLYETSNMLASFKQENERESRFVQKQLDALGEEPADGTKELKVIADKRSEFKNELSILKGRIAEADILQVKIDELNLLILSTRNHMLLGDLVTKQAVLIEPQNFIVAMKDLVQFLWNITISPLEWYYGLDNSNRGMVLTYLVAITVILIAALWLGLFLRRLIMRNWGYRPDIENPRYGQKITAALFVAVAYGVIPALIIGGFLAWMIGSQIFGDTFFSTVPSLSIASTYPCLRMLRGSDALIEASASATWPSRALTVAFRANRMLVRHLLTSLSEEATAVVAPVVIRTRYSRTVLSDLSAARADA